MSSKKTTNKGTKSNTNKGAKKKEVKKKQELDLDDDNTSTSSSDESENEKKTVKKKEVKKETKKEVKKEVKKETKKTLKKEESEEDETESDVKKKHNHKHKKLNINEISEMPIKELSFVDIYRYLLWKGRTQSNVFIMNDAKGVLDALFGKKRVGIVNRHHSKRPFRNNFPQQQQQQPTFRTMQHQIDYTADQVVNV